MKKILLAFFILLGANAFAQQKGIGYQAVIINPKEIAAPGFNAVGTPLANKSVCMSFQILNAAGQLEYQETQTLTTDQFGMVNLIIGNGTKTAGTASTLATVTWGLGLKTLVVGVNTNGSCSDYAEISRQALNYSPYALYAEDANVKDGAITTAKLADGSVTDVKVAMGINKSKVGLSNVDNTSDALKPLSTATQTALNLKANTADLTNGLATKVDKVTGKDLSTNDYTTAEKTKLAAITGSNTGDQDLSALATAASVALKANIASPAFSGVPTAPTAASTTNTTQVATTAFVNSATSGKFVDLTTNQTVAGSKTFSADISVNGLAIGKGTGQNDQNTAVGAGALSTSNASGTRNTAVGYLALKDYRGTSFDNNTGVGYFNMIGLTTGGGNTSIGAETMFNVASGSNNTAIGNQSLISTSGNNNVGVGARSGDILTTGSNNTFLGAQARTTTAGATISNATALGFGAIVSDNNTIQLGNTSVSSVKTSGKLTTGTITLPNTDGTTGQVLSTNGSGVVAWSTPVTVNTSNFVDVTTNQTVAGNKTFSSDLNVNGLTIGKGLGNKSNNTAIGSSTLNSNTSGMLNTANGFQALNLNTSGNYNTAIGGNSLNSNTTGSQNTSVGIESMLSNTTGNGNTALGRQSLASNLTGNFNTGLGIDALAGNTTGSYGVGLGQGALGTNTTGRFNTAVGPGADVASGNLTNATAIGNGAIVAASNTIQLGNTSVSSVKTSGALTTGNITYPTSAGTNGQVLTADGSGAATWVSAKSESNSIICKIADAPNTILSCGGFEFRYNSTNNGGFIEVRSNGNDNMMVFCQKNTGSWDLGGSTSTQNYRANTSVYSAWSPVISLWNNGSFSWSDRVTLSVYETFEATMFSMGNGPTIPSPLKSYKLYAAVDGYNQIFLKVDYTIN